MANITVTSDPTTHLISTTATPPVIASDTQNNIFVAAGGLILNASTGDAVRLSATTGVHTITIAGDVRGTIGSALSLTPTASVTVADGGLVSSNSMAILAQRSLTLNNAGTISGDRAMQIAGDSGTIVNAGSIFATSTTFAAIVFSGAPVLPALNTVVNTGMISSASGTAIQAGASSAALQVTNFGQILGGITLASTATGDRVLNTGLIVGTVDLGGGSDTYDARQGGRVQGDILLGSGNDKFFGSDIAQVISSSLGDDTFEFGSGNDTYSASSGDGNDTVDGGAGIDTYDASSITPGPVTVNLATGQTSAGAGTDAIRNFENVLGSLGADFLTGNGASNTLTGFAGSDFIDGTGGGADVLNGGGDNDTYIIDAGDTILDSGGADTVQSSAVNINLAAIDLGAIENATLLGSANLALSGTSITNKLIGNSGANTLTSFGGSDRLEGAAGNDTYVINPGDVIVDTAGTDTVKTSLLSLNLATLAGGKMENATLTGASAFNLDGNAGANTLIGNAATNRINGKEGKDILTGAAGNDTFIFNTKLSAAANADRITDFSVPNDIFHLENSGAGMFTGLANGVFSAARFAANATGTATDADDRIVYNKATGDLFFDSNGNAAGGAIKFATLANKAALTAADFFII